MFIVTATSASQLLCAVATPLVNPPYFNSSALFVFLQWLFSSSTLLPHASQLPFCLLPEILLILSPWKSAPHFVLLLLCSLFYLYMFSITPSHYSGVLTLPHPNSSQNRQVSPPASVFTHIYIMQSFQHNGALMGIASLQYSWAHHQIFNTHLH